MSSKLVKDLVFKPQTLVVLATCLVASLVGSEACKTPTEITLSLSTDAKCPGAIDPGDHLVAVAIVAGRPGGLSGVLKPAAETDHCTEQASANDIGTLVLVPQESGDEGVEVLVVAGVENVHGDRLSSDDCLSKVQSQTMVKGDPCIVARRRLGFIGGSKLMLQIQLDALCTGVVCDASSTCANGTCTSSKTNCDKTSGTCSLGEGGAGGAGGGMSTGALDTVSTGMQSPTGTSSITPMTSGSMSTGVTSSVTDTATATVSASQSATSTEASSSVSSSASSTSVSVSSSASISSSSASTAAATATSTGVSGSSSSGTSCPTSCAQILCSFPDVLDCTVPTCGCQCVQADCMAMCPGGSCNGTGCNCPVANGSGSAMVP